MTGPSRPPSFRKPPLNIQVNRYNEKSNGTQISAEKTDKKFYREDAKYAKETKPSCLRTKKPLRPSRLEWPLLILGYRGKSLSQVSLNLRAPCENLRLINYGKLNLMIRLLNPIDVVSYFIG
jgi:hypothetical protein